MFQLSLFGLQIRVFELSQLKKRRRGSISKVRCYLIIHGRLDLEPNQEVANLCEHDTFLHLLSLLTSVSVLVFLICGLLFSATLPT